MGLDMYLEATEYSDWYFEDLRSIVEQVTTALRECGEDVSFIYRASW